MLTAVSAVPWNMTTSPFAVVQLWSGGVSSPPWNDMKDFSGMPVRAYSSATVPPKQ